MKRIVRVLRWIGIGLAGILLLALGAAYSLSQRALNHIYDAPLSAFTAPPADATLLAEGERLARTRGCFGCHGDALEGRVFMDERWLARIVAPNLTRTVPQYSDAELERLIRRGVRRDGKGVWVMASNMYYHLTDEDLAAIVSYLRSLPPREGLPLEVDVRLLGRIGLATGKFPPITDEIDVAQPRLTVERGDPAALGRYLAITACTECHGAELEGGGDTPDLRIAAAYSPEQFARLMHTGIALGERETELMSPVARGRFSYFTAEEVASLYTYLRKRAEEQ